MRGVRGYLADEPETPPFSAEEQMQGVEALHVFSLTGPVPGGGGAARRYVWRTLLGWLLDEADEARLREDPYGRVVGTGPDVDVAVWGRESRQYVAVVRGTSVALSGSLIPQQLDASSLLPFTAPERSFIAEAPAPLRSSRLTRLWTRKEASLRLTGGGLSRAGLVDVLYEGGGGRVDVPGCGISAWQESGVAYVHDVPAEAGLMVSVATGRPVREVFVWQLDHTEVPVTA